MKDCNCGSKCTTCKCDLDAISDMITGNMPMGESEEVESDSDEISSETEDFIKSPKVSDDTQSDETQCDDTKSDDTQSEFTPDGFAKGPGIDSILDGIFAPKSSAKVLKEKETAGQTKVSAAKRIEASADEAIETSIDDSEISEDNPNASNIDASQIEDPEERKALMDVEEEELMEREIRQVENAGKRLVLEEMEQSLPFEPIEAEDATEDITEGDTAEVDGELDSAGSDEISEPDEIKELDEDLEMEDETDDGIPAATEEDSTETRPTSSSTEYADPLTREYKLWHNNIIGSRIY